MHKNERVNVEGNFIIHSLQCGTIKSNHKARGGIIAFFYHMKNVPKKLFLKRDSEIGEAIEFLHSSPNEEVIVNLPNKSKIAGVLENFQLLKDEGERLGKKVSIESVDEKALEMAELAGVKGINPVFGTRERIVADIVPRSEMKHVPDATDEPIRYANEKREPEPAVMLTFARKSAKTSGRKKNLNETKDEHDDKGMNSEKGTKLPTKKRKKKIIAIVAGVIIIGSSIGILSTLPKATVTISLKRMTIVVSRGVEVSTEAVKTEEKAEKIVTPGELLKVTKNIQMEFKGTGEKKMVEEKAMGMLTVYNEYSAEPQPLVATTRFEHPDGRIFRLSERVVIPGAKMENGKMIPAKLEVKVTADKPGPEYNVEPSNEVKWKIPGFKGGPRYDGFYAKAEKALSGGWQGERLIPNQGDMTNAKKEIEVKLIEALRKEVTAVAGDKFKLLEGASEIKVTRNELASQVVPDGFALYAEGELQYMVLDEEELKKAIVNDALGKIKENMKKITAEKVEMQYGNVLANFEKETLAFELEGKVMWKPALDEKELIEKMKGKNEAELKKVMTSTVGIETARFSLWPFWVKRVPKNAEKIILVIQ